MQYCYLVKQRGTEFYKIGFSKDPFRRVSEIRTGCPNGAELIGFVRGGPGLEAKLHALLADARIGGEWFRLPSELLDGVLGLFRAHAPPSSGLRRPRPHKSNPHPYVVIVKPQPSARRGWSVKVKDPRTGVRWTRAIPDTQAISVEAREAFAIRLSEAIFKKEVSPSGIARLFFNDSEP